ncbi:MAG TPA: AraC family transcriptional regulator [Steroidobacteraceae bacterium]|nr:AraC family transcriptional regulator [Steroidobacteraceae bacterium]HUA23688.1 AraC family transcriptional regulator [Steroidobacteraceae bacterium]
MRELCPSVAMSPALRVAEVQDSSSYLNRSLRSVASASIRVGHLVKQAMACFETDRKAAWRCLSDASTLLGADVQDAGVSVPSVDPLRPGGLATWQARRTLAYIEANLASKMDIDDLANVAALSRSHFSRAFKRSLGFSPMEYVVVRRVERAKAMISATREPLAEVALACGFADQAHLNRRFCNIVGISPGRWRRSNAAVPKPGPHRGAVVQATAPQRGRPYAEVGRGEFR